MNKEQVTFYEKWGNNIKVIVDKYSHASDKEILIYAAWLAAQSTNEYQWADLLIKDIMEDSVS